MMMVMMMIIIIIKNNNIGSRLIIVLFQVDACVVTAFHFYWITRHITLFVLKNIKLVPKDVFIIRTLTHNTISVMSDDLEELNMIYWIREVNVFGD